MFSISKNNIEFTKLVVAIVLGVSSFLCGALPLLLSRMYDKRTDNQVDKDEKLKAQRSRQRVVSLLMSFTGGVLFCTVFIHLLPEVGEVFDDLHKKSDYKNLPKFLPQALLCTGFFIMYFVEEIAHKLMHHKRQEVDIHETVDNDIQTISVNALPSSSGINEDRFAISYKHTVFFSNVIDITEEASKELSAEDKHKIMNLIKKALSSNIKDGSDQLTNEEATIEIDSCRKNETVHEMELLNTNGSVVRSFLLALALSVHALFEGMAIGLENKPSAVWLMLIGVGSHKMVLSVCMGVEMVAGNVGSVIHILYVTMFAIVSPIGIGAGVLVSSEQDTAGAIFQGIAAGTLLYVLFYEVLARSDSQSNNTTGFLSFVIVLIGFAVMLTLQVVADSDQWPVTEMPSPNVTMRRHTTRASTSLLWSVTLLRSAHVLRDHDRASSIPSSRMSPPPTSRTGFRSTSTGSPTHN